MDGFELVELLGEGGMGRVYLARERSLDRLVAIKFMTVAPTMPGARARFRAEARALARLNHPNVVGVYRFNEVEGRPYIAYEYVRGKSLDRIAKPIRWTASLVIAASVARGLAAVHRAGLLHRDIKPANVMVAATGAVKLVDFGLARLADAEGRWSPDSEESPEAALALSFDDLVEAGAHASAVARGSAVSRGMRTASNLAVGTPRYWAPEQWLGGEADAKSDVYALGLVIYEMVTGTAPFADVAGDDLMHAVLEVGVPRVQHDSVPEAFGAIIDRCLRRDPRERWDTATDLARALLQLQRVFVAATPEALTRPLNDEAAIVAASWSRLLPWRAALIARVYRELFAAHPEVRALFPLDLAAQQAKLTHALDLTLQGLHEPDAVAPMLRELGSRHVDYHVEPRHLEMLGKALLDALPVFDRKWDEATRQAWKHGYTFIAATMCAGMASHTEPVAIPRTPPPAGSPHPAPLAVMPPAQYASDGNVVYAELGKGPPALVLLPGRVTHLEMTWSHPAPVWLLAQLAAFSRVVLLDLRGTGMADRIPDPTVEDGVQDILSVMDAAHIDRAVLVGAGDAGPIAVSAAAAHPDRTAALVLVGSTPRPAWAEDFPFGRTRAAFDEAYKEAAEHWGTASHVARENPAAARDRTFCEWLASYQRIAAGRRRALALLRVAEEPDVRALLPAVQAPTLVLHRVGDPVFPGAVGRFIAERVPHGRYLELPGSDHCIFAGDSAELARAIERFVAGLSATAPAGC